jgi:hypothetical protein
MKGEEQTFLQEHTAHDVADLLERWTVVAAAGGLSSETLGEESGYPVVLFTGGAPEGGLYLSTGIHGDEPGGPLALVAWAEANVDRLRGLSVVIAPCLNPWGLANNVRTDEQGRDLNRRFDEPGEGTIGRLLRRIEGRAFQRAVMLHEDYDARGIYLYELAAEKHMIGEALLAAVEGIIPREQGPVDGRETVRGMVQRSDDLEEIVKEIDGMPEAIKLSWQGAETALTFETPSEFSLYQRVRAQRAFVEAVVDGM